LLALGADPNVIDHDGNTPLYYAAGRGFVEAVKLLLEAGAKVNAHNAAGRTPLDNTTSEQVAAILVAKKGQYAKMAPPKLGSRNSARKDPLYLAQTPDVGEAVRILLNEAVPYAPSINTPEIEKEWLNLTTAWGSRELMTGSWDAVWEVAEFNAQILAQRHPDFQHFQIVVYPELLCCQMEAIIGRSCSGFRIWRSQTELFVAASSRFNLRIGQLILVKSMS